MRVLLTMSHNNIALNIIPTLYEGYIVSVHRMVMENRGGGAFAGSGPRVSRGASRRQFPASVEIQHGWSWESTRPA